MLPENSAGVYPGTIAVAQNDWAHALYSSCSSAFERQSKCESEVVCYLANLS